MISLDKIKNSLLYDETAYYKNSYIKPFINLYNSSLKKSNYQLFHRYIFREDIFIDSLKKNSYSSAVLKKMYGSDKLFLKSGIPNYKNKFIKEKVKDHYSQIFIGYCYFSGVECNLFISLYEDPNLECFVNGFSVDTEEDKYRYRFENSRDLGLYLPKNIYVKDAQFKTSFYNLSIKDRRKHLKLKSNY